MATTLSYARPAAIASNKPATARVGPNTIIQLGNVLRDRHGKRVARDVFTAAGIQRMLDDAPTEMVQEAAAADLFEALFLRLPAADAQDVAAEAGRRTAAYILANRIPRPVQSVLKALPAFLAGPLLLAAIAKNAWTFAGSGRFTAGYGAPLVIEIAANPLAMPGCAWHRAVFEQLFRALAAPQAIVRHPQCCYAAGPLCRFEIAIHGS